MVVRKEEPLKTELPEQHYLNIHNHLISLSMAGLKLLRLQSKSYLIVRG